jgi:ubiquinone/menaquinone biosynthesis C-methylase UbiE
MLPDFDTLAQDYQRFRSGYSAALYERVLAACPPGPVDVLDLASGTGLSAHGLAGRARSLVAADIAPRMLRANPHTRVLARAEALPFRASAFDLVACAQAFHWMEPDATYGELWRVLRRGGVAALWWKYEAAEDPTARLCDDVVRRVTGRDPVHTDMAREAVLPAIAASPFGRAEEVRLVEKLSFTAASYVGYQASRENLRRAAGLLRERVLQELRAALDEQYGEASFDVAYLDRLCLLRRDG